MLDEKRVCVLPGFDSVEYYQCVPRRFGRETVRVSDESAACALQQRGDKAGLLLPSSAERRAE